MTTIYDFIFITNIPSFYKINLYNKLAEKYNIKVIFFSKTSVIRPNDFYNGVMHFDHIFLTDKPFEERNKFLTFVSVYKEIRKHKYKKIIYPGWELRELLILAFITPWRSNAIAVETCILETKKTPLIWWVKKQYVNRMSVGLPSGELQADIFRLMNFTGHVIHTNGVGIPHDSFYCKKERKSELDKDCLKYLYVGRLSEEKNPGIICKVASRFGKKLTIVGYGPLEDSLREKYSNNVSFLGQINNDKLKSIYEQHDVLVVPSKTEAWGLVIDEALCSGLVILASNQVGSINDLVINKKTGVIFDYLSETSLADKMIDIELNYKEYKKNVDNLILAEFLAEKIEPYSKLLDANEVTS